LSTEIVLTGGIEYLKLKGRKAMLSLFKTSRTILLPLLLPGLLLIGFLPGAVAEERDFHPRQFMDSRHNHNRSYPAQGQFVKVLPQGHREVFWGKERYHFFNGVWYRPTGRQFLVVSPPIGLIVPVLPPFYTTFWVSGVPYYYANEVYYTQSPVGYVVVKQPKGEISQTPPGKQIFNYPRQNQSEQTQAKDRRECQTWAVSQTNYDPAKPPAEITETQIIQKQADYQRALGACLEARGYSVK
jgi:hypothetical protein